MQSNAKLIYQQHIKPLSREDQLELLAEMARRLADETRTHPERKTRNLLELEGLGAEVWQDVSADQYK